MLLDGSKATDPELQVFETETGVIGACDDHLPVRWPARLEVIFRSEDYSRWPYPVALCPECLIDRLAEGYRIEQVVMI